MLLSETLRTLATNSRAVRETKPFEGPLLKRDITDDRVVEVLGTLEAGTDRHVAAKEASKVAEALAGRWVARKRSPASVRQSARQRLVHGSLQMQVQLNLGQRSNERVQRSSSAPVWWQS